ncbi:MAG: AlbA family DNA-binding domain-containing protein, partial [Solirubrobacteraceae bacterium]
MDQPTQELHLAASSLRKAVCGFANGRTNGYLIIGAEEHNGSWVLDGTCFPGGDPPSAITDLLTNEGVRPYPVGLDVRPFNTGDGRHIAVIRVPPVATPPCMTKGTVYE